MSATMILIIPCWESFRACFCISAPAPHTLSSVTSSCPPVSDSRLAISFSGTLSSGQPSIASLCVVLWWDWFVSFRPPVFCLNGRDAILTNTCQNRTVAVHYAVRAFLLISSLSFSGLSLSFRPLSSSSPAFRLCPERFLQLAALQSHVQSLCKGRTEKHLCGNSSSSRAL